MQNCADARFTSIEKSFSSLHDRKAMRFWSSQEKRFDLSQPLESFVDLCRSENGLASAIGMQRALADKKKDCGSQERAVYVIGVDGAPHSKIGVSVDPIRRLFDLDGGHYHRLHLHGVIFCPTRKSVSIEQEVLERATLQGIRMNGEWINAQPEQVLMMALESARDGNWAICDAQTWFDNMVERTRSFARAGRADVRYRTAA
jgi:hypothetical protein